MSQPATVGSRRVLRFCFTKTELTQEQRAAFYNGEGLPAGFGYDPHTVVAEYRPPNAATVAISSAEVTRLAAGEYQAEIPVAGGVTWWRGIGKNLAGEVIAATADQSFTAGRNF